MSCCSSHGTTRRAIPDEFAHGYLQGVHFSCAPPAPGHRLLPHSCAHYSNNWMLPAPERWLTSSVADHPGPRGRERFRCLCAVRLQTRDRLWCTTGTALAVGLTCNPRLMTALLVGGIRQPAPCIHAGIGNRRDEGPRGAHTTSRAGAWQRTLCHPPSGLERPAAPTAVFIGRHRRTPLRDRARAECRPPAAHARPVRLPKA
jgi:hypothetical protein